MALVVGLLALVLSRPTGMQQPRPGSVSIALGVLARWVALLVLLLAIGYVTHFSEYYPRRAVLTWAVATPAPILVATLMLTGVIRRLLRDPRNARRTVIAGYTEPSLALARRLTQSSDFCMTVEGFFDDRGHERLNLNEEAHTCSAGWTSCRPTCATTVSR